MMSRITWGTVVSISWSQTNSDSFAKGHLGGRDRLSCVYGDVPDIIKHTMMALDHAQTHMPQNFEYYASLLREMA